ncbi:MAG: hypothetical protein H6707_19495 [Deltaproteobacteria bacterium]|nr:hypothetical protein [Deltaproteobacteria bacterium]
MNASIRKLRSMRQPLAFIDVFVERWIWLTDALCDLTIGQTVTDRPLAPRLIHLIVAGTPVDQAPPQWDSLVEQLTPRLELVTQHWLQLQLRELVGAWLILAFGPQRMIVAVAPIGQGAGAASTPRVREPTTQASVSAPCPTLGERCYGLHNGRKDNDDPQSRNHSK